VEITLVSATKQILYFIPRYDPALMGNSIHSEVIESWRAHGVDAEVVTLAAGIDRIESNTYDGIVVHRLPASSGMPTKLANRLLGGVLHYPYLAGALRHFRTLLAQRRYDLLHVETAFPLGLVAALTPNRPPLAVTLPGADIMAVPEFDYGYGRFRAVRTLLRMVFRRADLLRADSPQIKTLAAAMGAPIEKITAIPYNITVDSYPPRGANLAQLRVAARRWVQGQHQLDRQRPIVVSLNRLHPFKGIEYLVEAIPLLRQAGINPHMLIVGPNRSTPRFGDYGAYLTRRAEALGVADAVIQTGGVPHERTLDYLAAADAVVVPSVAESFSRVVVEAAAAGTPPVVTRTTGVSDYVAEFGNGLVVDPRSGESIGQALVQLLQDRQLWQAFADRCPPMAARFSSEQIATELLDLYQPWVG
jgi:glycosyltransferase involved in cell wall biosynthesis